MGDLIQKLPTDNHPMPPEEKENFVMLFPDDKGSPSVVVPQQQQNQSLQQQPFSSQYDQKQKLKKEILTVLMFVVVFFVLNIPQVKNLIVEYIPMCHKSWMITNAVQAVVFAFILWVILNSEYSRV